MPELLRRHEDGLDLPFLVWRLPPGVQVVSSAVLGGGIGPRRWILNAQVRPGYDRVDPERHVAELAARAGLDPGSDDRGEGVGLLTAADVGAWQSAVDGGVRVDATVGVRVPTWAARPEGVTEGAVGPDLVRAPGTINIVALVPARLSDAALVNLVATATEAKTQALLEAGVDGTGTATDAVCIVAGLGGGPEVEPFGGPRSTWGARTARAVHAAVLAGTIDSRQRIEREGHEPADGNG